MFIEGILSHDYNDRKIVTSYKYLWNFIENSLKNQ